VKQHFLNQLGQRVDHIGNGESQDDSSEVFGNKAEYSKEK
jgi:hypothetical protein